MPSIWANFDHVFEVFQGLFFAFLLSRKDGSGNEVENYQALRVFSLSSILSLCQIVFQSILLDLFDTNEILAE